LRRTRSTKSSEQMPSTEASMVPIEVGFTDHFLQYDVARRC